MLRKLVGGSPVCALGGARHALQRDDCSHCLAKSHRTFRVVVRMSRLWSSLKPLWPNTRQTAGHRLGHSDLPLSSSTYSPDSSLPRRAKVQRPSWPWATVTYRPESGSTSRVLSQGSRSWGRPKQRYGCLGPSEPQFSHL